MEKKWSFGVQNLARTECDTFTVFIQVFTQACEAFLSLGIGPQLSVADDTSPLEISAECSFLRGTQAVHWDLKKL